MQEEVFERIRQEIAGNDVVLYMKGTSAFPQCGYSAAVANILDSYGVRYKDVNVLEDRDLHQGIKDFTNWPNVPQLYIKGEFIGGCDIVRDLHASGKLHQLLEENDLLP